jgi:hypothetical protein
MKTLNLKKMEKFLILSFTSDLFPFPAPKPDVHVGEAPWHDGGGGGGGEGGRVAKTSSS